MYIVLTESDTLCHLSFPLFLNSTHTHTHTHPRAHHLHYPSEYFRFSATLPYIYNFYNECKIICTQHTYIQTHKHTHLYIYTYTQAHLCTHLHIHL